VDVLLRAKGIARTVLMTDANQAAGLGDGSYTRPGDRHMTVENGVARLPNGKLAGSVLTMDRAVANAVDLLGLPLRDALRMATDVAAESLGFGETLGLLAPRRSASLVLMNDQLEVVMTMVDGDVVYETPEWNRLAGGSS
jgi:N-acetylglucosamine-6-phosphate deacetylase